MSSFKVKNRKKVSFDNRVTLDAKHNDKLKYFKENKKKNNNLKENLKKLEKEYSIINNKTNFELTDIELNSKKQIEENMIVINKEINYISNNVEEINYLLDTGKLLYQYYNNIDLIAEGAITNSQSNSNSNKDSKNNNKTVIDFFKNTNDDGSEVDANNIYENIEDCLIGTESNEYLNNSYITREKLLDKYMNITDKNYILNDSDNIDIDFCKICNIEKYIIQSEGVIICPRCGIKDKILIDSDKPSYKDPPREISYFAYKRINHFNELKFFCIVFMYISISLKKT